jgi:hypothetical protein
MNKLLLFDEMMIIMPAFYIFTRTTCYAVFSGFIFDSASSLKQHPQEHVLLYKNTFFILQFKPTILCSYSLLHTTNTGTNLIVMGFT